MLEKLGLKADEVVGAFPATEEDTGGFCNFDPKEFCDAPKMVEDPPLARFATPPGFSLSYLFR